MASMHRLAATYTCCLARSKACTFMDAAVLPKLAAAAEQRAEGKVALPDGSNHLQVGGRVGVVQAGAARA